MQWKLVHNNALTISSQKPKVALETWNPNGKIYTDSKQVHSSKDHRITQLSPLHKHQKRVIEKLKMEINTDDIIL